MVTKCMIMAATMLMMTLCSIDTNLIDAAAIKLSQETNNRLNTLAYSLKGDSKRQASIGASSENKGNENVNLETLAELNYTNSTKSAKEENNNGSPANSGSDTFGTVKEAGTNNSVPKTGETSKVGGQGTSPYGLRGAEATSSESYLPDEESSLKESPETPIPITMITLMTAGSISQRTLRVSQQTQIGSQETKTVPDVGFKETETVFQKTTLIPRQTDVGFEEIKWEFQETIYIPGETEVLPTEYCYEETTIIPPETTFVPYETDVYHHEETSAPPETEIVPAKTEVLLENETPFPKTEFVIQETGQTIPQKTKFVPDGTTSIPQENELIFGKAEDIKKKTEFIPVETAVPQLTTVEPTSLEKSNFGKSSAETHNVFSADGNKTGSTSVITQSWSAQPETSQKQTAQPETVQPETSKPETSQPETSQSKIVQSVIGKVVTVQPETSHPETAQPKISQSKISQSGIAQVVTVQPETTKPETVQPETSQSNTSKSGTSQPATSQIANSQTETAQPGASNSESVKFSSKGYTSTLGYLFMTPHSQGTTAQPPKEISEEGQIGTTTEQVSTKSTDSSVQETITVETRATTTEEQQKVTKPPKSIEEASCSHGFYYEPTLRQAPLSPSQQPQQESGQERQGVCYKCHEQCGTMGCSGSGSHNCHNCKEFYFRYDHKARNLFSCVEKCPGEADSQKNCVDEYPN